MRAHPLPEQRDLAPQMRVADEISSSGSFADVGYPLLLPQLRVPLSDERILNAEQRFLDRWQHVLSLSPERLDYMRAWYRGLVVGFGTPANEFFDTLNFSAVESVPGKLLAPLFQVTFSGRFNQFLSLKAEDGPLVVPAGFELTNRIDPDCGCCQSSMHAERNALDPEAFPIIMFRPAPGIQLIPNRFPWDIGGVLIEPIDHDDLSLRSRNSERLREPGMTAGSLISENYLEALFRSAHQFDLVVFQNHPLSGMSQPFHVHAHGIPAEFPKGQIIKSLAASAERPETGVALATSHLNVTDVLLISSADTAATVSYAAEVLRNLELNHQVYTFACYNGCVAIAPEYHPPGKYATDRGARTLLHWLRPQELDGDKLTVGAFYPEPGQFNWQPYLPARPPSSERVH